MVTSGSLSNFRHLAKKIICVGRNYGDNIITLGKSIPQKPLLFLKSTNSIIGEEGKIQIPYGCNDLYQEVELAVIIGKKGYKIEKKDANNFVGGYTVALDMTANDFLNEAKKEREPWFLAKSFDTSCVIGPFISKDQIKNPQNIELFCKVNGKLRQKCNTNHMIFDIPTLISYISQYSTLEIGDILLTGTPSGISNVVSGDEIEFGLTNICKSKIFVA
ncbi:Acylpyruvase FAHD1, mitochondrial [Strongyloides ratti]|uniref:oxaloacetate tautomerase n=1 Tax=Strongyloides ratti TaxID=34506 RepID=A0A090LK43_STRRB|nr:Acylpyruvase FAHD1, mitochondrial [Strongyloides ratti]CEF70157.1 Acylpyruvase FAHD1, mitochondrial [Strongyloides ratti]